MGLSNCCYREFVVFLLMLLSFSSNSRVFAVDLKLQDPLIVNVSSGMKNEGKKYGMSSYSGVVSSSCFFRQKNCKKHKSKNVLEHYYLTEKSTS